jgi:hypothetical protein
MARIAVIVALPFLALLAAGAHAQEQLGAGRTLDRALSDRPDDVPGRQLHVVYVLPSDGADQGLDTSGAITTSVAAFQRWFADQTDGRWLRIDTAAGVPDVTFLRLAATTEEIANAGTEGNPNGARFHDALVASGFTAPEKVYLLYYGGTSNVICAGTSTSPTVAYSVVYLANQPPRCRYAPLAAGWPAVAGAEVPDATMVDYVAAHEALHLLGVVPSCAPHYGGGMHVTDDRNDLMSARYVEPIVLDRAHDDYFGANAPGCTDLSASPFLTAATLHPVSVTVAGGGRVRFTGGTRVATCVQTCSETFPLFTTVRFVTVAEAGFELDGWDGDCAGAGGCAVYVDGPKRVVVRFVRERFQVRVAVSGKGRVSGNGLACPPRCSASVESDSRLRLVARAARGWRFVRWRGACSGSRACVARVAAPAAIRAQFVRR